MSYIHLAIPVFFLLIAIELLAAHLLERGVYRLSDSINDLSCGILDQVLEVFVKTFFFAGYLYLYDHHRLYSAPGDAVWAWVVCLLGVDFLYYWFHRWSHEANLGWAAHIVHHQSEEYNLTVALRQGAFQGAFSWVFYLPLALLGFPPLMFLTVSSANTLYQFWIHTRLVGRLGPLEWFLNTPSHHRVHHGRNPQYIDKNHAGSLIIWDRMFGTFATEQDEPVYGITNPIRSWNPLWAQVHYWVELAGKARRTGRWADRLRLFWKRPGWQPDDLGGFVPAPEVDRATYRKYDPPAPRGLRLYVFAHFVVVDLATIAFLFSSGSMPALARGAGALAVVVSVASLGGLLDQRSWGLGLEAMRIVAATGAVPLLAPPAWGIPAVAFGMGSLLWLLRHRDDCRGVSRLPRAA
jgi:sterol desaturase/sphingolipid hydroxylase (fatty acid hydroxylase superfamily)